MSCSGRGDDDGQLSSGRCARRCRRHGHVFRRVVDHDHGVRCEAQRCRLSRPSPGVGVRHRVRHACGDLRWRGSHVAASTPPASRRLAVRGARDGLGSGAVTWAYGAYGLFVRADGAPGSSSRSRRLELSVHPLVPVHRVDLRAHPGRRLPVEPVAPRHSRDDRRWARVVRAADGLPTSSRPTLRSRRQPVGSRFGGPEHNPPHVVSGLQHRPVARGRFARRPLCPRPR